eukprot:322486_1
METLRADTNKETLRNGKRGRSFRQKLNPFQVRTNSGIRDEVVAAHAHKHNKTKGKLQTVISGKKLHTMRRTLKRGDERSVDSIKASVSELATLKASASSHKHDIGTDSECSFDSISSGLSFDDYETPTLIDLRSKSQFKHAKKETRSRPRRRRPGKFGGANRA